VKVKWLINSLFAAVPATIVVWYLNRQGTSAGKLTFLIFALALVAVVPLATSIGNLTETLETYLGERLGGLLGASFGNVPELAIGIALLVHAHIHLQDLNGVVAGSDLDIVHALLIGSVINNVLFVLGSSIFIAALRNGRMNFSADNAAGYASMMALAVVGLALPTIATKLPTKLAANAGTSAEIAVTIPFAVILILSYTAYIAATEFNIGAHGHQRAGVADESGEQQREAAVNTEGTPLLADTPAHETRLERIVTAEESGEEQVEEKARELRRELRRRNPRALPIALVALGAATIATVIMAVILVSVTDNVIRDTPLTPLSVGLILFPIVCNLGEQAGAVQNAWHNRMEGAMAVAAGSSVQVALFVTPVLALISFALAGGTSSLILTIIFQPLLLIVLGLVTFVYALVSLDGETTWLEGLQLLAFYAMVVAVAFVLPGR
jgi:Ca2+:H+ antiporter